MPRHTLREALDLMLAYGPEAIESLNAAELDRLAADVHAVAAEDGGWSFLYAAREHARRLGGPENLPTYLRCLS